MNSVPDFQIVTVLWLVIGFLFVLFISVATDCKRFVITYSVIILLYIFFIDGWESDITHTKSYTTTRTLVSASPSHTQINGNISGSFLMFSGVIGENRVYLLREEVEKGLYKDFEVKHEVYIREDNSLTNKGKFVQYFTCNNHRVYFDLVGSVLYSTSNEICEYSKQEIVVPQGSVIKELNI